ncbi:mRNA-capping enzyme subunit beta [Perkinsus chesapeaki]|uniref:mRNA 5'-phosphatase n=1 Tax=Perkinsus chesapeaki TaxID=330153 RepID=A0A7J6MH29_PERCH|nr:mRNA-capping enzyme subunit beta [Perkinsus chesapeaki]
MSGTPPPAPAVNHHQQQHGKAWQHPLETGPLTVCGTRPPLLEPLVDAICKAINEALQTDEDLAELEIEARLGFLAPHRDSYQRVLLPITSPCILQESDHSRNWRYEFQASVMREQFYAIQKHLEKLAAGVPGQAQGQVFRIKEVRRQVTTTDEFFESPKEGRIRASYDSDRYSLGDRTRPIEIIRKDRLKTLNIFSGHYDPTYCDEEKYPLDIRISVNRENKYGCVPSDVSKCTGKRNKTRHSYLFKAWEIDLTEVIAQGRQGEWSSYEVEVELKKELIAEQLKRQRLGKNHAVYEILTDFVYCVRDLAWMFGDAYTAAGGQQWRNNNRNSNNNQRKRGRGGPNSNDIDFTMWIEPDEIQQRYLKRVAPVFPIIGDYCFTIADEILTPKSSEEEEDGGVSEPTGNTDGDVNMASTEETAVTEEPKEKVDAGPHEPQPADVGMTTAGIESHEEEEEPLAMPEDLEGALALDMLEGHDEDEIYHPDTPGSPPENIASPEAAASSPPPQPPAENETVNITNSVPPSLMNGVAAEPKAEVSLSTLVGPQKKTETAEENDDNDDASSTSSSSSSSGSESSGSSSDSDSDSGSSNGSDSSRAFIEMARVFLFVGLLVCAGCGLPPVYIVRHAEKPQDSPSLDLSLRGEIRAAALSAVFFPKWSPSKFGSIDVVITQQPSDDFPIKRELQTAEAIIANTSTPLRLFRHADEIDLLDYLERVTSGGQTPLLVWEHYRIPAVAVGLLLRFNDSYADARYPVWADDRYDMLWELNLESGRIDQHCLVGARARITIFATKFLLPVVRKFEVDLIDLKMVADGHDRIDLELPDNSMSHRVIRS